MTHATCAPWLCGELASRESLGLHEHVRKNSPLPFEALEERFRKAEPVFKILQSKDFGMRWLIEQVWDELGYRQVIDQLYLGRKFEFRVDIAMRWWPPN